MVNMYSAFAMITEIDATCLGHMDKYKLGVC